MKNRKSSPSCKSKDDLQKRRIKAIKLWEKGQTQYKIAKKLGVSFEAVSNWVEAYKAQGWDGPEKQRQSRAGFQIDPRGKTRNQKSESSKERKSRDMPPIFGRWQDCEI